MTKEKVVCLTSGGLDSTTLLYDLEYKRFDVHPIAFNYGQRHIREIRAIKETCIKQGLNLKVIDVPQLAQLTSSVLTNHRKPMPHGHYTDKSMKETVVPNRNLIFLSYAATYAISIGAQKVFYGAHAGDHTIYADCRPEFIESLSRTIYWSDDAKIELYAPYQHMSKTDILRLGVEQYNVDYSKTWTCYEGEKLACGKCGSCVERLEAFNTLNIIDPIQYMENI